ncbi:hypothetical protein ACFQHV_05060 [Promicromonospora thailandica]|nr:hypothetical protein [Promicromonospora thailandica]
MSSRTRVVAALSGLLMLFSGTVTTAAAASDAGISDPIAPYEPVLDVSGVSAPGPSLEPDVGVLDLNSNPQVSRNGGTVGYTNFSAARGTQSPGWFPSTVNCPRGYVCIYTPYRLTTSTQYWRMWKLYDPGLYDFSDFLYNGTSYLVNNQTGGWKAVRTDAGNLAEPIAPWYCASRVSQPRGFFGTNYYPAWGIWVDDGRNGTCTWG